MILFPSFARIKHTHNNSLVEEFFREMEIEIYISFSSKQFNRIANRFVTREVFNISRTCYLLFVSLITTTSFSSGQKILTLVCREVRIIAKNIT